MAATTPAGGAGALAMMASTISQLGEQGSQRRSEEHLAARSGVRHGPTFKMLQHLMRHRRASARELAHAAGVESVLVGPLLKYHVQMGRVRLDKTFRPAQYVVEEDTGKHKPYLRKSSSLRLLDAAVAELLQWHAVASPPDCNRTVLCWGPDGPEMGWFDAPSGQWYTAEGMPCAHFTHWAEPEGPPGFERDTDSGEG